LGKCISRHSKKSNQFGLAGMNPKPFCANDKRLLVLVVRYHICVCARACVCVWCTKLGSQEIKPMQYWCESRCFPCT